MSSFITAKLNDNSSSRREGILIRMLWMRADMYAFKQEATRANIESMMAQHQARMTQMEQATAAKIEGLRAQNETLQRQNHRDSQQNQQLQRDLKKDHAMSVEELKQMSSSSTPMEIMMRFERRSNEMAHEIHGLRTKLQDRGFLAPLRITQPDPIEVEERPPVGTIELAQDVFTARLLLRLGFLKANSEQEPGSARMLADKEDDEWSEVEIDSQANDNVCGIVIPEVEESGAWKVKCGWLVVCSGTAGIQLLALTVMLLHGLKLDGDDCYKETPTLREWFLLHTSKGLAMLVAATLMGGLRPDERRCRAKPSWSVPPALIASDSTTSASLTRQTVDGHHELLDGG